MGAVRWIVSRSLSVGSMEDAWQDGGGKGREGEEGEQGNRLNISGRVTGRR